MQKILSLIIYFISFIIITLALLVFITENTNYISNTYTKPLISIVEKKSGLNLNINNLETRWHGLNVHIALKDFSLYKKDSSDILIEGERILLQFNLMSLLYSQRFIPYEINLVNSDITLDYINNKLYMKDYDLLDTYRPGDNANETILDTTKFRISDSNIQINDLDKEITHKLLNINMVVFNELDNIKIFSTFNHQDTTEVIHLASVFKINSSNKFDGIIFSRGINVNTSDLSILPSKLTASLDSIDYSLWAKIQDNAFIDVKGLLNIDSGKLENLLTKEKYHIEKLSTEIDYQNINNIKKIHLGKLNFKTKNNDYDSNNILMTIKDASLADIAVDEINLDDINYLTRIFPNFSKTLLFSSIKPFQGGVLSDLVIRDINDNRKRRYQVNFRSLNYQESNDFSLNNLTGRIIGESYFGTILIDSKNIDMSLSEDNFKIDSLIGNINYRSKDGNLILSSQDIYFNQNQAIKVYGNISKQNKKYKFNIRGDFKTIFKNLPSHYKEYIKESGLSVNSQYDLKYISVSSKKKRNSYGILNLNKLVLGNKNPDLSFNSDNLRIGFYDKYIYINEAEYYINNLPFQLSLDTKIRKNQVSYSMKSKGTVTADLIKHISNYNLFQSFTGESKTHMMLTYRNIDDINIRLKSDMQGMSFNMISPFKKVAQTKKNIDISFKLNNNKENPLNIIFEEYKLKILPNSNGLLIAINSPSIKGNLSLPDSIDTENRINAKLDYFDLNKFEGVADPMVYPFLNLEIYQAKINKYYFNNFVIRTAPASDGMVIERLSFDNNHLSMLGTGKWINSSNGQLTFFDASFSSGNFGTSLGNLGYSDVIKKGKLKSQLIGQWRGSPDIFSLDTFDGKIILDLKDGEFLQVTKQTKAIGQLLGLFSISSLQKRLTLDFSDFFSSGLSFETMNGEFIFLDSSAEVNNLVLKGTFGEMRINGSSSLKKRTHDQELIYIPDLSSMSLISGTLLGGPIGAVASIFYDKVLKEMGINTNQLAAVEYSIKGSWDNPEINVIESFKPIEN